MHFPDNPNQRARANTHKIGNISIANINYPDFSVKTSE